MKLIVNPHKVEIQKDIINEKEINISKCEFEFAEEITENFVKEAYFTFENTSYKEIITNNKCDIPHEVLEKAGQVEIGVVAYLIEDEEEIKRYNPSPAYFNSYVGSLKEKTENSQPITPSEMEQFEQALEEGLNQVANVDIDAEQIENGASVTITNRNGEDKTVNVYNGEKGDKGDPGKDGKDGKDGVNGTDGVSPTANITQTQSGATIRVTDSSGTTTANITNGTNGQDGYTPVRGTDYWTASDISTIESYCNTYINTQLGPVNDVLATLTTVGGDE